MSLENETVPARTREEAELNTSVHLFTCRPLPGMYHVVSKVTGDTWNRKIVRSPSTSGRCCRDRRWTAGRRRVGNQPTNDFPATRRRQHRRPSRCRVQPFLNATPLRRPRYLITRFTHSSSISASRGTFPPGRYTRARRVSSAKCIFIACCGIGERFFRRRLHTSDDARARASQLHARSETRAARPFFSFSRVSHTARRRHDVANGAAASFGRTRRLASKPPISPSVATTRAIPRCRGSGARLTGRIPAVSRPSRRMPS